MIDSENSPVSAFTKLKIPGSKINTGADWVFIDKTGTSIPK